MAEPDNSAGYPVRKTGVVSTEVDNVSGDDTPPYIDAVYKDVTPNNGQSVTPIAGGPSEPQKSVLDRDDIRKLVDSLSMDPRHVGEPLDALRTTQAQLALALSGVATAADFRTLVDIPSRHVKAVLTAMTDGASDTTSKEIHAKMDQLEHPQQPQQNGRGFNLPKFMTSRPSAHAFGDQAVLAEEACTMYTLRGLVDRAVRGDPKAGKNAVKQVNNLHRVHKKMAKNGNELMQEQLQKSGDELQQIRDNVTKAKVGGLEELRQSLDELIDSIMKLLSRLTGKSKAQAGQSV